MQERNKSGQESAPRPGKFKQVIERIPVQDLIKLVAQMAAKNQEVYDLINHKYVGGEEAEREFFEAMKEKVLGEIWLVSDRGRLQKNLARGIGRAVKHINYLQGCRPVRRHPCKIPS